MNPAIFHAYDIRGIYPTDFDEPAAYAIGQAYVRVFQPAQVVVGRDVRLSSPALWQATVDGITDAGVGVIDIGTISTDMLYFTVANYGFDGGIIISASHNPREYNGMKMVRKKSTAISSDTGLFDVRDTALKSDRIRASKKGNVRQLDFMDDYLRHVLSFIDTTSIVPQKIVMNANFGMAGQAVQKLIEALPAAIEIAPLNFTPDGNFPKGRPDPLIRENREETATLVREKQANFATAWDADGDRCFFFDENGEFVAGYFITALLAETLLKKYGSNKIIFDPRLTWAVGDTVKAHHGEPLINKAGHTFMKDRMRQEDALFGGEISGHYYFRDNFYADNGLIPFLLILEMLCRTGQSLAELAAPFRSKYFISDEENSDLGSREAIEAKITEIEDIYSADSTSVEHIDGLSIEYGRTWRFNLRPSNTEPLLRLNVEAQSEELMREKTDELLGRIRGIK